MRCTRKFEAAGASETVYLCTLLHPRSYCWCRRHRTKLQIILFLRGHETWCVIIREEHRLRVYVKRVLRTIFGPQKEECHYVLLSLMCGVPCVQTGSLCQLFLKSYFLTDVIHIVTQCFWTFFSISEEHVPFFPENIE